MATNGPNFPIPVPPCLRGEQDRGALVLRRRAGEEVELTTAAGERIVVRVTQTNWGFCRLRIEAPRCVRILRGELVGRDAA